jgi:amino acid adenylation domain-containing protein
MDHSLKIDPISKSPFQEPIPVSYAQERYWLLSLVEPDGAAYHCSVSLRLRGNCIIPVLNQAAVSIIERHKSLRTIFVTTNDMPEQRILPFDPNVVRLIDLASIPLEKRPEELNAFKDQHHAAPFDLTQGPLFRCSIVTLDPQEHVLVLTIHRIIADENSIITLAEEIGKQYSAFLRKDPALVPDPALQFGDFAVWQCRQSHSGSWDHHITYWKERLSGELPILQLYTGKPRPPRTTYGSASVSFELPAALSQKLQALCTQETTTLYSVLLSAYILLLHRHSGQEDIVIGLHTSGRVRPETQGIVGRFSTLVPFRSNFKNDPTFLDFLRSVRDSIGQVLAHQELPFEKLLQEIKIPPDLSRHPLFQVTYDFNDTPEEVPEFFGLTASFEPVSAETVMFDCSLNMKMAGRKIQGTFKFNAALFSPDIIEVYAGNMKEILQCAAADPGKHVSQINLLTKKDKDVLLNKRNATARRFPSAETVHQLFERQAQKTPDAIAVRCGSSLLTYSEFNHRSNQCARFLQRKGVEPGNRVAVCMNRSTDLMVALMGIVKAGALYVPVDPAYPSDRQAFMINDASARAILTQQKFVQKYQKDSVPYFCLDSQWDEIGGFSSEELTRSADGDSLLYMIFTSGSTGNPKGSLVYHRGFINLVQWYIHEFGFNENTRILIISSLSFDLTQKNLFAPLACGGEVVLLDTPHYDAGRILDIIDERSISSINCTPSAFYGLLSNTADHSLKKLRSLAYVFLGGEPISTARLKPWTGSPWFNAQIVNSYGPTECTDVCVFHRLENLDDYAQNPVPIGRAIANTRLYVLDRHLNLVPDGAPGELCIGGIGVGAGYVNRPELNSQKFIPDPFAGDRPGIIYKTGDVVRYRPDGVVEFLGRMDHQVKIRGFRIELDEIVAALERHESIREAYVMAVEDSDGEKRLAAYIVWKKDKNGSFGYIRSYLQTCLPEFMIPALWVEMDSLPTTPNGKIDRNRLPPPKPAQPVPAGKSAETVQKSGELLECIRQLWKDLLQIQAVGLSDRFFDIGGTSLKAIQFIGKMGQTLGVTIPMVTLFEAPTVSQFAEMLKSSYGRAVEEHFPNSLNAPGVGAEPLSDSTTPVKINGVSANDGNDIAIIGMAVRYPGARNIDEFWANLRNGVESIKRLSDEDLLKAGVDPKLLSDENYVKACACMDDVESFDALFFGFNPREVQLMDPQHRVILECAWSALEHAGYVPDESGQSIGIFTGVARDAYLTNNLVTHADLLKATSDYSLMIGNEKDFPATRVSYKLNLSGPSINIQTACSSSGVGMHLAAQSLGAGECDIALVGGCRVLLPANTGYQYVDGGTLSPDGHVRAFDARAQGMVRGSGVGFVVLKRLSAALSDNDTVYAVIKGTAINNDGASKVGFTAPSVTGQAAVIERALKKAGISADTVGYVEAHGTGTSLGDPIEVTALTKAFSRHTQRKGFCAIGSVKTNIGHLDAGSCVAGAIKTALSLYNGEIPPSLNFEKPNPQIDFENSPFFVNAELRQWPAGSTPRRAGVSSFGLGGTNAHIILEEAPHVESAKSSRPLQVLPLSAKSQAALDAASAECAAFCASHESLNLADVAYTLQTGRRAFPFRRVLVCSGMADAAAGLKSGDRCISQQVVSSPSSIVFMFPGQGAQHVNMGRDLYLQEPVFRETVDQCAEILKPLLDVDLRTILYPQEGKEEECASLLNQTGIAQPALFTIEYATARQWMAWGISPDVMVGHSIGEYVAACISGVFSLEDSLTIIATRARLMQSMPSGAMRAVRLSESALHKHLVDGVSLAAANAPNLSIVSGPHDAIAAFDAALVAAGDKSMVVHTSHAFHSSMMLPVLPDFTKTVARAKSNPPSIPIVSTVTGTWMTADDAQGPGYWARQLVQPVRFSAALQEILKKDGRGLIEAGPSTNLSNAARQHLPKDKHHLIINSLPHATEKQSAASGLYSAFGRLWLAGAAVSWASLHANEPRRRLGLPTYPFERKRFWIDPFKPSQQTVSIAADKKSEPPAPLTPERDLRMTTPAVSVPSAASAAVMATGNGRLKNIEIKLRDVFFALSGIELNPADDGTSFLELGMDSLLLTQAAAKLQSEFGVAVKFRQLVDDCSTVAALAGFIDTSLPAEAFAAESAGSQSPAGQPEMPAETFPGGQQFSGDIQMPSFENIPNQNHPLAQLISQQMQLMSRQLELLTGKKTGISALGQSVIQGLPNQAALPDGTPPAAQAATPAPSKPETAAEEKKFVGPALRITKSRGNALTPRQQRHLGDLIERYTKKTRSSKAWTNDHRRFLADPRAVAGFKPALKELIYPIVVGKSLGSKLWDIDGNEYVDMLNGFGSNFFGHRAPFVMEAVAEQLKTGIEIGPQHPLAGELAKMLCDYLGHDRVAFCNTGSEAVIGAMRIARTVTGRDKIAMFVGAYHGIFDEVIVRGTKKLKSLPAAPGIQPGAVENMLVLDYGTPETLEILKSRANELAAVLVEPVQSRLPELQPREFLHELRKMTEQSGTVLIFDEVVTGFRTGPHGAQGFFNIQADIATYGKVLGGGMNIGVIGGKSRYLDALDGGSWNYGDESIPEVGVTYFAGTFVRHPPALVAAKAVLNFLIKQGPSFQQKVTEKTEYLVSTLNAFCESAGIPIKLTNFASVVRIAYTQDVQLGELLFVHLREKGVHIWDHRPVYMTAAHSDQDISFFIDAFKGSIEEMQMGEFLPRTPSAVTKIDASKPPCPDARLGRDPEGNPAWFVPDKAQPGKYLQIGRKE